MQGTQEINTPEIVLCAHTLRLASHLSFSYFMHFSGLSLFAPANEKLSYWGLQGKIKHDGPKEVDVLFELQATMFKCELA